MLLSLLLQIYHLQALEIQRKAFSLVIITYKFY